MQAFLISAALVALAEIGDRTQLLGLVLAAKHRKPLAVILGIIAATLANHLAAATFGAYAATWIGPNVTRWIVGLGSIAFALWILRPDQLSAEEERKDYSTNAILDTFVWFFLVEIGDKTQIATIGLAAKYGIETVVAGSVLGLVAVNVPTVFAGAALGRRIPIRLFRYGAAIVSLAVGIAVLAGFHAF
jgi:putative Ca2+/H+ antiporter (TMEM165/GDT1 family)